MNIFKKKYTPLFLEKYPDKVEEYMRIRRKPKFHEYPEEIRNLTLPLFEKVRLDRLYFALGEKISHGTLQNWRLFRATGGVRVSRPNRIRTQYSSLTRNKAWNILKTHSVT